MAFIKVNALFLVFCGRQFHFVIIVERKYTSRSIIVLRCGCKRIRCVGVVENFMRVGGFYVCGCGRILCVGVGLSRVWGRIRCVGVVESHGGCWNITCVGVG